MVVRFKSYDRLALFTLVARHLNFTAAADELHMTKGAISYQIRRLESDVGFALFKRQARGVALTVRGSRLLSECGGGFAIIDAAVLRMREPQRPSLTIGLSTYFASRWLSSRLMGFTQAYPELDLRLQPSLGHLDADTEVVDLLIRWGVAGWFDSTAEKLFDCAAFPTANPTMAKRIVGRGWKSAMSRTTLLHDSDDSPAWKRWHEAAGLSYHPRQPSLVIPDPNVRVQAVIDGQGIALNDALVDREIGAGQLVRISDVSMSDFGYYLVFGKNASGNPSLQALRKWLLEEAKGFGLV